MGTKSNPAPSDCYAGAMPDEPLFTLLARDPDAPYLVELWAIRRRAAIEAGERPDSDREVVAEALRCAEAMRRWRSENDGSWRRQAIAEDEKA